MNCRLLLSAILIVNSQNQADNSVVGGVGIILVQAKSSLWMPSLSHQRQRRASLSSMAAASASLKNHPLLSTPTGTFDSADVDAFFCWRGGSSDDGDVSSSKRRRRQKKKKTEGESIDIADTINANLLLENGEEAEGEEDPIADIPATTEETAEVEETKRKVRKRRRKLSRMFGNNADVKESNVDGKDGAVSRAEMGEGESYTVISQQRQTISRGKPTHSS